MENIERRNNWSFLLNLFLFTLISTFFVFVLNNDFITAEDYDQIFFNFGNLSGLYNSADHGCVICYILMKIVAYGIPHSLGLHPNDDILGIIFRAVSVSFLVFSISKFSVYLTRARRFYLYFTYLHLQGFS